MNIKILLIIFIFTLGIGATFYNDGGSQEELINKTNQLEWNIVYEKIENSSTSNFSELHKLDRVESMMYKGIDFIGYTAFESAKMGVEIGYDNPQHDYMSIGKVLIILMLIGFLLPLIVPLIVGIYLLFLLFQWMYKISMSTIMNKGEKN